MKVLCVGDVVGKAGRNCVNELMPKIKKEHGVDFTIVNAENAAGGAGLTPRIASQLFRFGCDVLTLGDHVWDRLELADYLNEKDNCIRPANFPEGTPGRGFTIIENSQGRKVGVINLLGRVFMRYNVDCPFRSLENIVARVKEETNIIIVDFHGEATSEKIALGFFIDGKASVLFGTHTHVQTADDQILPNGTAYISDLGMTGPHDSVIGQNKEKIIKRFVTSIPMRFEVAKEKPILHGIVVDIDDKTGLAKKIERIKMSL